MNTWEGVMLTVGAVAIGMLSGLWIETGLVTCGVLVLVKLGPEWWRARKRARSYELMVEFRGFVAGHSKKCKKFL